MHMAFQGIRLLLIQAAGGIGAASLRSPDMKKKKNKKKQKKQRLPCIPPLVDAAHALYDVLSQEPMHVSQNSSYTA